MAFVNNVVFVSAAGSGPFSVLGPVAGYQTPIAAGVVDGRNYRYRAQSEDMSQWELGTTVPSASGTSFTRAVLVSSNGGLNVDFDTTPTIMLTWFAQDVLSFDESMGLTGPQQLTGRTNIGLGQVDDTSDTDKPISTATQAALDAKLANSFTQTGTGAVARSLTGKVGEVFSITDFGAVADGVTNNDAAFAAAILASFNSQSVSYPGSTVHVPGAGGAYRIENPIDLRKGVNLIGDGGQSSVILAVDCNAINDTAVTGFGKQVIRDLYFKGTGATAARTAINYPGTTDVADQINGFAIQDCLFRDFDTGINLRSVIHPEISGCWIENVNQGILLSGAAYDVRVSGNTIIYAAGGGTGGTTFTGVSLYPYTYATGGVRPPEGVKILENTVYGFDRAIDVDAADTVNIHSNVIVGKVYGVRYKDVTAYISITDNNIEMQTTNALVGVLGATPTSSTDTKHSIIQNNSLKTSVGATACWGVKLNASGLTGQNDVIIENNFVSLMQGYDIACYGPAGNTKVLNNRCRSTGNTGSIVVGGVVGTTIVVVAGNRCANNIDIPTAVDLTNGAVRTYDNSVPAGNEHSSWYLTSAAAPMMTFTGPAASRKTYTLPNASDTIVTLAATQALTGKTVNGVTLDNLAWTAYTPTVTSGGGTPTTTSATGRYKQIGKTVFLQINAVVTSIGTATGAIRVTVPVTPSAFTFTGSVMETTAGVLQGTGLLNGAGAPTYVSLLSDSTTFWVNGTAYALTLTYEAA